MAEVLDQHLRQCTLITPYVAVPSTCFQLPFPPSATLTTSQNFLPQRDIVRGHPIPSLVTRMCLWRTLDPVNMRAYFVSITILYTCYNR